MHVFENDVHRIAYSTAINATARVLWNHDSANLSWHLVFLQRDVVRKKIYKLSKDSLKPHCYSNSS